MARGQGEIPWIFTWGCGLCDALLVWGTLDLWLYTSGIDVRPGTLPFRGEWLGFARPASLSAAEVEGFRPKRGLQSGKKQYDRLEVAHSGGSSATLAKRVPHLYLAEGLAGELPRMLKF